MTYKKTKITCALAFLLSAVLQLIMLHKSFGNFSQILLLSILLGAMMIVAIMFFTEYKQNQTSKITTEFIITYQDVSLVIGIIVFLLGKYLPLNKCLCTILFCGAIVVLFITLVSYIKKSWKEKLWNSSQFYNNIVLLYNIPNLCVLDF